MRELWYRALYYIYAYIVLGLEREHHSYYNRANATINKQRRGHTYEGDIYYIYIIRECVFGLINRRVVARGDVLVYSFGNVLRLRTLV